MLSDGILTPINHMFPTLFPLCSYCVTSTNAVYSFSGCSASNVNTSSYHTYSNQLFTNDGTFNVCGVNSFKQWQSLGQDAGSMLSSTPTIAQMVAAARAVLKM